SYQIAARFSAAPLAYALSGLAAAVYVTAAVALKQDRRALLAAAAGIGLAGGLIVGTLSLEAPFPDETVCAPFRQGDGVLPLALPGAALVWLSPFGRPRPGTRRGSRRPRPSAR